MLGELNGRSITVQLAKGAEPGVDARDDRSAGDAKGKRPSAGAAGPRLPWKGADNAHLPGKPRHDLAHRLAHNCDIGLDLPNFRCKGSTSAPESSHHFIGDKQYPIP